MKRIHPRFKNFFSVANENEKEKKNVFANPPIPPLITPFHTTDFISPLSLSVLLSPGRCLTYSPPQTCLFNLYLLLG